jgi:nicotinamidase/pyrazinamidase
MIIDPAKAALIVVDMQPDFMPGHSLPVAGGDELVAPIASLMSDGPFRIQVATQDWHPPDHISFASSHPGHEPMDIVMLYGHEQVLWPDHCVQGAPAAAVHPMIPLDRVQAIVRKATDAGVDSYSAFRNNWNELGERPTVGLAGYLRDRGVSEVFLCGLARDFCVQWSAEDAVDAGFATHVIWDLTRSVDPSGDDRIRLNLASRGVVLVSTDQIGHSSVGRV